MAQPMTYDPKKVTVAINGRAITGFANDGVITLTHNEDIVTPSVGAQGDVAYSENANNSGNAALPLMSTSASLAYLRDLCAKRKALQISVSDANNTDEIHVNEENCRILKMPDTPRGREQATVTVNVFIPDLNYR
jgi:hypothetical protein